MAFSTATWDETKPAGTRQISLGDDDIREGKSQTRERLAVDHDTRADEAGAEETVTPTGTIGYHKKVTLTKRSSNPTNVANTGILFTKDVAAVTELFFIDAAGNVIQLTSGGILNDSVNAKTGDWLSSSVTTARTGWTNVSATYADKFIRINATPLTTGGADAHTHTTNYLPAHTHTTTVWHHYGSAASVPGAAAGIGSAYNLSGEIASSSATAGSATTSSTSNVPAYVQGVLFQKD